ncbi:hypothetical protein GCM10010343_35610 [Streptomyces avidinii]|nr:hypothetical protein GCM10010343_35610 [Streptomyces avidinii]
MPAAGARAGAADPTANTLVRQSLTVLVIVMRAAPCVRDTQAAARLQNVLVPVMLARRAASGGVLGRAPDRGRGARGPYDLGRAGGVRGARPDCQCLARGSLT